MQLSIIWYDVMFAGERVLEFVGNRLNFCVKMFSEAVCGIVFSQD